MTSQCRDIIHLTWFHFNVNKDKDREAEQSMFHSSPAKWRINKNQHAAFFSTSRGRKSFPAERAARRRKVPPGFVSRHESFRRFVKNYSQLNFLRLSATSSVSQSECWAKEKEPEIQLQDAILLPVGVTYTEKISFTSNFGLSFFCFFTIMMSEDMFRRSIGLISPVWKGEGPYK